MAIGSITYPMILYPTARFDSFALHILNVIYARHFYVVEKVNSKFSLRSQLYTQCEKGRQFVEMMIRLRNENNCSVIYISTTENENNGTYGDDDN